MMKAIVMAGGKGTRIRPLTSIRPKPMIPVANRPLIHYIIERLRTCGLEELVLTLNYLPHEIKMGLKKRFIDLQISYSLEKSPLGTAGGVRKCKNKVDDTFLVISGDVMVDINWEELLKFHHQKNALATIILTPVKDPTHFGIAVMDENKKIKKFLEKPSPDEVFSKMANTGIYIFENEIFDYIPEQKNAVDFSRDIFPLLIEEEAEIYGYTHHGYWNDVGRPSTYLQANYDVLNKNILPGPEGTLLKEKIGIFGDIWCGEHVFFKNKNNVRINGPVVIGKNCKIGNNCRIGRNTVLGNNVVVGDNTHISGSVILDNNTIKPNSYLKNCIIDTGCFLEEGTTIEKGAILGSRVRAGHYSQVKSKCIIGCEVKIPRDFIVDSNYNIGNAV
ncbi:NDP-sugar synthase [Methanobacterium movens]